MTNLDNLTPKQAQFVAAMLTSKSITAACQASGVVERTGHRWLKLAHVQAAIRQAQSEALALATRQAVGAMPDAIGVLVDIMADEETHKSIRITAARSVLEYGYKFTDLLDHEERLAALEALQNERN